MQILCTFKHLSWILMRNRHPFEQLKFLTEIFNFYDRPPLRPVFRVRVEKFRTKVGLVEV